MRTQCTAAILLVAAAAVHPAARAPRAAPVTYAHDVQPILAAHCTVCHSPDGPSPMPLASSADASRWARAIATEALARRMPVWHAARGYGAFSNDPSLSPYELDVLGAWAEAQTAPGQPEPNTAPVPPKPAQRANTGTIPAGAVTANVRTRNGWITGWDFLPGDPLITSATFTLRDGSVIGTWTAGDRAVTLPHGSAMRIVTPVRVDIRRRGRKDYETPFTARPSSLRLSWWTQVPGRTPRAPSRRVWTERLACGGALGPTDASVIGVRPLMTAGASSRIGLERTGGAPPVLVGWFRGFDPNYPRIYWLAAPIDFAAGARVASDAPCDVELLLSARR